MTSGATRCCLSPQLLATLAMLAALLPTGSLGQAAPLPAPADRPRQENATKQVESDQAGEPGQGEPTGAEAGGGSTEPQTTASADAGRSAAVGMASRIEQLVLPGPELEVKPIDDEATPIVLRIADVFPHGDSHRYDLVYYGLEPGRYDLRDYLRRKDGSPLGELPELSVTIEPVLPPGQVQPNELTIDRGPYLGGYRLAWILGGLIWFVGLFLILFMWPKKGGRGDSADEVRPRTLAERLRPVVEQAVNGEISESRLAELERLLVAFWRKRLGLDTMKASEAIVALREHPDAGALLQQLEHWLHRPGGSEDVDIGELLRPYQDLPPDALESPQASASGKP